MTAPRLPASPWEVSKHATPDHAPQFGIYAIDTARAALTKAGYTF